MIAAPTVPLARNCFLEAVNALMTSSAVRKLGGEAASAEASSRASRARDEGRDWPAGEELFGIALLVADLAGVTLRCVMGMVRTNLAGRRRDRTGRPS